VKLFNYFKRTVNAGRPVIEIDGKVRRLSDKVSVTEDDKQIVYRDHEPLTRHAVLGSVRAGKADATKTELSFSSDAPVMMWGEPEVLSHDPEDADFSRLAEVGAVLRDHNPSQIVGRPENVRLDIGDRKGRLSLVWGSTDTAAKAKHEALIDRSLRGVSVGYQVDEYIYFKESGVYRGTVYPEGTWLAAKWQAIEASLTPVAADPSVGVGRNVPAAGEGAAPDKRKQEGSKVKWWIRFLKTHLFRETEQAEGTVIEVDETDGKRLVGENVAVRMLESVSEPTEPAAPVAPVEPTPEPDQRTEPDIETRMRDLLKAGRERREGVRAIAKKYDVEIPAEMIEHEDFTVDKAREFALEKLSDRMKNAPTADVTVTKDGRTSFRKAATEALLMRVGGPALAREEKLAGKPLEQTGIATPFMSLVDLARESLQRANIPVQTGQPDEIIELAMRGPAISSYTLRAAEAITVGTSDFPYILANVANKEMLAGAEMADVTYPDWCKIGSLRDFRQGSRLKLSEAGKLEQVVEFGEYEMTKFGEQRETLTLLTYGKVFNLSRQAIINDDLNAFTAIPRKMGEVAAILPNDLAVIVLLANGNMSDGTALFATAHNNISDNLSAYGLDTIAKARAGIGNLYTIVMQQTAFQHADISGEQITLRQRARVVLVPPTNWQNVDTAIGASSFGEGADNVNPLKNKLRYVIEPSLEDTNFTGNSTVAYYEFVDPNLSPVIEVAFLNGNTTPYMEEVVNTGSAADGRVWKVRHDCVAGAVDWRGAAKEVSVS